MGLQDNHKETPKVHTVLASLWERGSGACKIHHFKFVYCTNHTYVRGGISCTETYGVTRTRGDHISIILPSISGKKKEKNLGMTGTLITRYLRKETKFYSTIVGSRSILESWDHL
jgi:hypothetical protein